MKGFALFTLAPLAVVGIEVNLQVPLHLIANQRVPFSNDMTASSTQPANLSPAPQTSGWTKWSADPSDRRVWNLLRMMCRAVRRLVDVRPLSLSSLFHFLEGVEIDRLAANLIFCKNAACNAWDKAPSTNSCKHFANGVWASQVCGCLSCSNECSGIPE